MTVVVTLSRIRQRRRVKSSDVRPLQHHQAHQRCETRLRRRKRGQFPASPRRGADAGRAGRPIEHGGTSGIRDDFNPEKRSRFRRTDHRPFAFVNHGAAILRAPQASGRDAIASRPIGWSRAAFPSTIVRSAAARRFRASRSHANRRDGFCRRAWPFPDRQIDGRGRRASSVPVEARRAHARRRLVDRAVPDEGSTEAGRIIGSGAKVASPVGIEPTTL